MVKTRIRIPKEVYNDFFGRVIAGVMVLCGVWLVTYFQADTENFASIFWFSTAVLLVFKAIGGGIHAYTSYRALDIKEETER